MLARKILLHDKVKFAVASAGVSISVLLVLIQIGLYFGFMQNASNLIDHAGADLWVTGRGNDNFDFASPIDERLYYRVAETPGVARSERMILAFGQFKLPSGGVQGVQVVGLENRGEMLRPWNVVQGDVRRMSDIDGIVVDMSEFGKLGIEAVGARREVTGIKARVIALTSGIRSFTASPFVFTNMTTARAYSRLGETQLTYLLVKVAPGETPASVKARIAAIPNVDVYTKAEFSERTRTYWSTRTGVGSTFFMNSLMAIIVGLVVVGQILYNGTLDHLKEYGTMKAMGAENGAIVSVIAYQALLSAAIGFTLGGGLALLARSGMRASNLNVALSPALMVEVGVMTAVMCLFASVLSILKVLRLDPAAVFKG